MKVKQQIQCLYCTSTARLDEKKKAMKPGTTRYGCSNAHYFAVPTKSVEVK